jgi:hypothetical protein
MREGIISTRPFSGTSLASAQLRARFRSAGGTPLSSTSVHRTILNLQHDKRYVRAHLGALKVGKAWVLWGVPGSVSASALHSVSRNSWAERLDSNTPHSPPTCKLRLPLMVSLEISRCFVGLMHHAFNSCNLTGSCRNTARCFNQSGAEATARRTRSVGTMMGSLQDPGSRICS